MKVYIVMDGIKCEGAVVDSVYLSKKKAEAAASELRKMRNLSFEYVLVKECKVTE